MPRNLTSGGCDLLYGADLLIVFDARTFPFGELADAVRDVPIVVVPESDPSAYLEWIGPFDRLVVPDDGDVNLVVPSEIESRRFVKVETEEPMKLVWRLLADSGDILAARRAKCVHRVHFGVVRSALSGFSEGTGIKVVEVRSSDAPSLLPGSDADETESVVVESLASGTFAGEGFDAAISAGSLQFIDAAARADVIAGMWRAVRPGGKIIAVDQFVFGLAARERMSVPPASVSGYIEDVMRATSGRVTLDLMQSLKYPPDEVHRAAILAFRKL